MKRIVRVIKIYTREEFWQTWMPWTSDSESLMGTLEEEREEVKGNCRFVYSYSGYSPRGSERVFGRIGYRDDQGNFYDSRYAGKRGLQYVDGVRMGYMTSNGDVYDVYMAEYPESLGSEHFAFIGWVDKEGIMYRLEKEEVIRRISLHRENDNTEELAKKYKMQHRIGKTDPPNINAGAAYLVLLSKGAIYW